MSIHEDQGQTQRSRSLRSTMTALSAYPHNHRKTTAVASTAVLIALIMVPYVYASRQDDQTKTRPSQQQANMPATELQAAEEAIMPRTTNDNNADDNTNSNQTSVTVNGQSVEVPESGSYHKVTEDDNGRTEVTVESRQSGNNNSSNSSSSSVNIDVNSQSHSSQGDPD